MQQVVSQVFAYMGAVPAPLIYLIVSLWVGLESLGFGLPVEPMLLFAGSLAAQGRVNVALIVLFVCLGCLLCASIAYAIGARVGTATITRFGRYIGLSQTRADHLELWLRQRGGAGVFLSRIAPMVRTFTSYVMGAAGVPLPAFAIGTFLGSAVYCGAWVALGDALGAQYAQALAAFNHFGPLGIVALVLIIALVVTAHHLSGRLSWRRLAEHYHRHAARGAPVAVAAHR